MPHFVKCQTIPNSRMILTPEAFLQTKINILNVSNEKLRGLAACVGERSRKFFYHLVAQINLRVAQFHSRHGDITLHGLMKFC